MAEKLRQYANKPGDALAAFLSGASPEDLKTLATIPESDITKFCRGCDKFKGEGIPCSVGSDDQARYAARKWCGWARVEGERVIKKS